VAAYNERQVVELFRPLLEKIDLLTIPAAPDYLLIELGDFDELLKRKFGDCILTIRRRNFMSTPSGYYTFSFKTTNNRRIFFLNIFLSNILFVSNSPTLRIKRHRTFLHEFTHCIAAFLSMEKIIKISGLISDLSKKLEAKSKLNNESHYQSLLVQFGNNPISIVNALEIFPDEHFRIGYENFNGSFSNIYKKLTLDTNIFEKYFTLELQNLFYQHVRKGEVSKSSTILRQAIAELVSNEAISSDMINLRLREELLPYYYMRAFDN